MHDAFKGRVFREFAGHFAAVIPNVGGKGINAVDILFAVYSWHLFHLD